MPRGSQFKPLCSQHLRGGHHQDLVILLLCFVYHRLLYQMLLYRDHFVLMQEALRSYLFYLSERHRLDDSSPLDDLSREVNINFEA